AVRVVWHAGEGGGVRVRLAHPRDSEWYGARWRRHPEAATNAKDVSQWRRNGAGAQILAELGLGKLRVLGTPRRQVGLAGFGLEVVEYLECHAGEGVRSVPAAALP
ncbi:bifunctional 3,4-dihydroxy-2-butanone-4-phosphate synthase/GTP cyclohydrolase II, partial [Xanthomonas hortorum pv. gardneri]